MWEVLNDIAKDIDKAGMVNTTEASARYSSFGAFASVVINTIMAVSFSLGIFSIALSMVLLVLSVGNPDNVKKAWRAFLWGVIATLVSLAIVALKRIIIRRVIGVKNNEIYNIPGF
jgi:vacuolar-type H+-ATPase subunit I/STV1